MLAGWYMDDKGKFSYWENEQVVSVYVTSNRIPGSVLTSE